jgi:hypothetical protein
MERYVEAQVVDSRHLKLKRPIPIAPGSTVMIAIQSAEGIAEEEEWYLLSSQAFGEVYGDNEPDYPAELIKTPNPEYQP